MTSDLGLICAEGKYYIGKIVSIEHNEFEDAFEMAIETGKSGREGNHPAGAHFVGAYIGYMKFNTYRPEWIAKVGEKSKYRDIYNDFKKAYGIGVIY